MNNPLKILINIAQAIDNNSMDNNSTKYKLTRTDGLVRKSKDVLWIEWDEDGKFKAKYDEPAVGRSLLMGPFNPSFTWQTTPITEFEIIESVTKFKTNNSEYTLEIDADIDK